ncbi:MAG: helix-turn-helix domain-containing protein [Agriterribacter sp.]
MKKRIRDIADPKISNWEAEASIRRANPWMRHYSSQIARRILSVLDSNPELTQSKLAAELGVSSQYISKVLKGRENLTLETIYKLSKALRFDLISFPDYAYNKKAKITSAGKGVHATKSLLLDKHISPVRKAK